MKKLLPVSAVLLAMSFHCLDSASIVFAKETSPCAQQKKQAIADFNKREFKVAYSHCGTNAYYAEEIFYNRYNLKIEIARFDMGCLVPSPESLEDEKNACYYRAIDSLLYRKLGNNIYERVEVSADSFAAVSPHRYDCQPFGAPVYIPCNDSIIPDLRRVLRYPTNDDIEGVVYVAMTIDTSGTVSKTVVKKGVRHDLDSSAVASAMLLGKFTPVRRWGIPKEGLVVQPIRFSRY